VKYQAFEELSFRLWERIPWDYRQGVDGLVVERRALPHPTLPDIFTLGECSTEAYPSDFGGPDTIRSVVVLYWGSFRALSKLDPDFDWETELWETLTHELQHHLEALASEDELLGVDYAMDENFKRLQGEPYDPAFYRSGSCLADGVYRVENDFFLEHRYRDASALGERVRLVWHGAAYEVTRPADPGEQCFIRIMDGLEEWPPGEVYLVLVRQRGLGDVLRGALRRAGGGPRRQAHRVVETEEPAERVASLTGGGDAGAA
jgi:hypothetical protein